MGSFGGFKCKRCNKYEVEDKYNYYHAFDGKGCFIDAVTRDKLSYNELEEREDKDYLFCTNCKKIGPESEFEPENYWIDVDFESYYTDFCVRIRRNYEFTCHCGLTSDNNKCYLYFDEEEHSFTCKKCGYEISRDEFNNRLKCIEQQVSNN